MSDKKYFGMFTNISDVRREFVISDDLILPNEVLFAAYLEGSYSGEATVLFVRGGQLYEVSETHCSCSGLDELWRPEEVSWAQLAMRPEFHDGESYDDPDGLAEAAWNKLVRSHAPRA